MQGVAAKGDVRPTRDEGCDGGGRGRVLPAGSPWNHNTQVVGTGTLAETAARGVVQEQGGEGRGDVAKPCGRLHTGPVGGGSFRGRKFPLLGRVDHALCVHVYVCV